SGPTGLFDIDTLTKSMNYQPVLAGNQPNSSADPRNTDDDATFEVKEPEFEVKEHESTVHVSLSSSAKTKKHDARLKERLKARVITPVLAVGKISTNSTNTFSAACPSNTVVSLTLGKSSYVDPSQYIGDPNMPALEDITYFDEEEDVGAETDFTNLETTITVSPIPTTRVHNVHPVTQIIGDLSLVIGWLKIKEEGIDYEEVFAPIARIEAIRLFLAYASFMGFMVYQMDVKSAFLYGTIKEEVYVCQPPGFEDPNYPDKVYKVKKDGIFISQDKYVAEILRKFGLTDGKSASTTFDTEKPLLKDPDGKDVDVHTYRSMIGSLMYLTSSRPDIMFAVCACARFQVTPKASHLHAVKRIFRYLKGKPYLGLWYPKDSPFNLVAYSDSDYAGASLDRKSTTGGYQFLGCRLISWQCKKQTVIATSSTKAEYVATTNASEGFEQILDFWNASVIQYALNVNLIIYVSCIKQFWSSILIKNTNDVVRLQDLTDRKKVIITEDTVCQALHLDDAKSVDCLPNEEIFAKLPRMGYDKPSTKLTFYKAFFLAQWKFLIHNFLQCMSVKRIAWNEFSSFMASAVICLATGEGIAKLDANKDVTFEEIAANLAKDAEVVAKDADAQGRQEDAARRRKEVVIRDPKETATPLTIVHSEPKSKDKRKAFLVEEPKPHKKQAQIEQDKAYTRELEAELNKNINRDDVIEQVKRKENEDNAVLRYQALKRKPQTEAHARKNMMVYLKNMAGFKMDFFKGMSYDAIKPISEKHFNSVVGFLEKSEEQLEEEASRALKRKSKSSEQQAVKKQKLDEEVEELKKHLQIVPNDEDDVYTKATPLALKVPIVDYQIYIENNKPYYKIIRADETHQLFLSFFSLLRNFDREDLEML
nr:uncharacterized mitochondrial protein AtMg00810-like [Tanacetum cinerariifolium]